MCLVPTWLLFEGGRHDLEGLYTSGPSLAGNHPDAEHSRQLSQLNFTPQTNAYGSVFFVLSWALDLIVLIGLALAAAAFVRSWREGEHWRLFLRLHLQMVAHFAYFVAAMAAVVYGTLNLSPHVLGAGGVTP